MFGKTRYSYYKYLSRRDSELFRRKAILDKISRERTILPRCGTRKLHIKLKSELLEDNIFVGRDRLHEILREKDLHVKRRKRSTPITTYSEHKYAVAPNILKTIDITEPGQATCADITYVRICNTFGYLFLITDLCSRFILGHHLSDNLRHDGAIIALEDACRNLTETDGVIHHTDRGVQYCCHDFKNALDDKGMISSMTDDNHCAQNAIAERVNGILKGEFLIDTNFRSFQQARTAIKNTINIYNYERPHMSLGYSTPSEVHFAELLEEKLAA